MCRRVLRWHRQISMNRIGSNCPLKDINVQPFAKFCEYILEPSRDHLHPAADICISVSVGNDIRTGMCHGMTFDIHLYSTLPLLQARLLYHKDKFTHIVASLAVCGLRPHVPRLTTSPGLTWTKPIIPTFHDSNIPIGAKPQSSPISSFQPHWQWLPRSYDSPCICKDFLRARHESLFPWETCFY
jgi:hypothetical protein